MVLAEDDGDSSPRHLEGAGLRGEKLQQRLLRSHLCVVFQWDVTHVGGYGITEVLGTECHFSLELKLVKLSSWFISV